MAGRHAPSFIPSTRYKPGVAESIEQLSFELTANALAEQERALAELRTRAGTVLAVASIAGSFLATKTNHGALGVCGVLAMVCFALCIGSSVWVVVPHKLALAPRGNGLLHQGDSQGSRDVTQAYRAAGRWIEPRIEINHLEMERLSYCLALSCLLPAACC
jgi:hypothetical protein